jgi:hypothetical protein
MDYIFVNRTTWQKLEGGKKGVDIFAAISYFADRHYGALPLHDVGNDLGILVEYMKGGGLEWQKTQ